MPGELRVGELVPPIAGVSAMFGASRLTVVCVSRPCLIARVTGAFLCGQADFVGLLLTQPCLIAYKISHVPMYTKPGW